jgi:hypothetical protein
MDGAAFRTGPASVRFLRNLGTISTKRNLISMYDADEEPLAFRMNPADEDEVADLDDPELDEAGEADGIDGDEDDLDEDDDEDDEDDEDDPDELEVGEDDALIPDLDDEEDEDEDDDDEPNRSQKLRSSSGRFRPLSVAGS